MTTVSQRLIPEKGVKPGYVYLMKAAQPATRRESFKIGTSKDPIARRQTLQSLLPPFDLDIELLGTGPVPTNVNPFAVERAVQDYMRPFWLKGEYYDLAAKDVHEILECFDEMRQLPSFG